MKERIRRIASAGAALLLGVILALAAIPAWGQGRGLGFERARAKAMLKRVSREIEKKFYDPNLRGLNWKQLTAQARQRIENADSIGETLTAIFALTDRLQDSHTVFIPPGRVAKTLYGFQAKPFGDEIRIYELKKKGAAAAAGLQRGDRLWAINGVMLDRRNFDLFMLYIRVLRPVSVMEITYSRGNTLPRTVRVEGKIKQGKTITDLTRGNDIFQLIREVESAKQVFRYRNHEGGIGYLALPSFTADKRFMNRLVNRIKKAQAVIIDLRGNRGGAVEILKYVCGYFEAEPTVIAEMAGRKEPKPIKVKPRPPALHGPLFILADSQSASAAEIFARHFQRNGRAVVIGDRTAGKVTVARFYPMQVGVEVVSLYGLSVATARLVFPDGEELENRGVTPDRLCIPTEDDLREDRDPCRRLAVALARSALGLSEPGDEKEEQKDKEKKY